MPLNELHAWTGDDRAPELVIRVGTVPAELDDRRFTSRRFQVAPDGTCRLERPGLATFLIRGGREVVVESHAGSVPAALVGALLGPVLGIICHQRELLPLHACCVEIDGVAVAIAGPRGAGKSTLAGAFMRAGHRVLADDLTVIDTSGPDAPLALPGIPRLKLSDEVLDILGVDGVGLERNYARPDKRHLPIQEAYQAAPVPLCAICHLGPAEEGERTSLDRLAAPEAVAECAAAVYGPRLAARIVGRRALFLRVAGLATAVDVAYRLSRGVEGPSALSMVAAVVNSVTSSPLGATHRGAGNRPDSLTSGLQEITRGL